MPLPGQVTVAEEFRTQPRGANRSLRTRIEEKRNLTRPDNPQDINPSVPDWLQVANPLVPIPEQERKYFSRLSDQSRSVDNLGTAANEAVGSQVEYKQREAAARAMAKMRALSERSSEIFGAIGDLNFGFDFGTGGASGKRGDVIAAAKRLLGTPYSWGGGHGGKPGPSYGIAQGSNIYGVDCSGLVRYAFAKAGIKKWGKSATSQIQSMYGRRAKLSSLLPGDLVVKGTPGRSTHIAIYVGGGKIIEAQKTGTRVHIRSIKGEGGWIGIHLNY